MRRTFSLIASVLTVAGCRGVRPAPGPAGVARARADTVGVLEAVWRVPAGPMTFGSIEWLYLPDADPAALTVSEAVRAALARRGVPASARRPAGHDTVVHQVRRWSRDVRGDPVLAFSSSWTRMTTGVPSLCATGGNEETYRARRSRAGWKAERIGPILHATDILGAYALKLRAVFYPRGEIDCGVTWRHLSG
jgi:hypothetical protein